MRLSRACSRAGAMISFSSVPIRPFSPACGLSDNTAIRGFCTPKSRRKERSRRVSLSTISSLVRASGTLETGVWTVARATRICSLHRIMSALLSCSGVSAFVSDASRYSVWPGKLNPGLCIECLSIGAVTRTSIAPSRKSVTAASRAAKAAAPAASDSCPGSILRSSPTTLTILNAPSRASDALSTLLRLTCGSSMALR